MFFLATARPLRYHRSLEASLILPPVILLQVSVWDSVLRGQPVHLAVLIALVLFSLFSWAIILAKWKRFRTARVRSIQFMRAFRKAAGMEAVAMASEQFRAAPLVTVFDFGYSEVERQVKVRGTITNKTAVERALQLGMSEEMSRLEHNMSWLATTATVSPFIGLFGTVWGIIDAFHGLGQAGSASLRAVAPGISQALVATALGLAAAIPAAMFYNYFGHLLKQFAARMEDFALEFLNAVEDQFESFERHETPFARPERRS
ncbi:MAG: MotA/TolQ/ExbB proton channel family protein [Acidobacteria bacterium]|nr:MotA/TolQ/ExbB proton channel family protein [Acidobacteriota bacterium]MBI3280613.1 MotA/TolQ/ExbB proton channel family protein [Acidobacteriota bacterium]